MEIADRVQEYFGSQLEPDTLLPMQYNEILRRRSVLEGEHKLMFAVLEDAVKCHLKHMNAESRRQRLLFYEVRNWMNTKNRVGLFSYQTLCESLGIDAKALSAALESRLSSSERIAGVRRESASRRAGKPAEQQPANRLGEDLGYRGRGIRRVIARSH
ncbi:MAG: hypothetical protein ABSD31_11145 [Candidatus Binataceae bacterium]